MPELSELRALLRDRQLKDGALGSCEATVCLDTNAVDDLNELETERSEMVKSHNELYPKEASQRLAGPIELPLDTSEIDARVEQAKQVVRDTTVVLTFRAASSVRYQEILNDHPEASPEGGGDLETFLVDLARACFQQCRMLGGERMEVSFDELRENLTFGEWEPIGLQVLAINRRKVDVPFSLRPSKKIR